MKAVRVSTHEGGTFDIGPLALPTAHRAGTADPAAYRRLANGEMPKVNFGSQPSDVVRAISLDDGPFTGLASQPGALLTFVVSGDLMLTVAGCEPHPLQPGDILLTDGGSSSHVTLDVRNDGRLVQINVPSDWPATGAEVQQPGHFIPRKGAPKLRRMYKGDDDKAYFTEFRELFPAARNEWSSPRPVVGFRMVGWKDGEMDWHPSVIGQLGFLSCGEMEIEVGGGGGAIEHLYAGDISLAEDTTGQGHIVRARGYIHVTNIVIEPKDLWPYQR